MGTVREVGPNSLPVFALLINQLDLVAVLEGLQLLLLLLAYFLIVGSLDSQIFGDLKLAYRAIKFFSVFILSLFVLSFLFG